MAGNALQLSAVLAIIDKASGPLKGISKDSKQTEAALKSTTQTLKQLQQTNASIGSFKQLQGQLKATSEDLEQARQKLSGLENQFTKTQTPTKKLTRELEAARKATAFLEQEQQNQLGKMQQLQTSLTEAGIDTKNLAAAEKSLQGQITATNQARKAQITQMRELRTQQWQVIEQNKKMEAVQRQVGSATMWATGVTAAGTAALSVPIKAYADAEDAATGLQVALMNGQGKISPEFAKINELATGLGNRLPGTTADFQNMMTMLVRQGIPAENILNGVGDAAANLAVLLKMPPVEAAEFAAKMQDATRTTSEDMLKLMDVIQKGFYLGVDQNNMLEAFKNLGPVMDMVKQKGLEGSKALAPFVVMMDQAGMKGESAGNAVRKIVQGSLDVDNVHKVLKDLKKEKGINLSLDFTNGKGEWGGYSQMFEQLKKLRPLDTATRLGLLKDIYGNDAEVAMTLSTMIEKGQTGYDEVVKKMQAQASLQQRVNAQLKTLRNLWDATSGTFINAAASFGESISPELKELTDWIGKASEATGKWAKAHPELAAFLMKTVAFVVIFTAVLAALGGAFLVLAPAISAGVATLGLFASPAISAGVATLGLFASPAIWLAGKMGITGLLLKLRLLASEFLIAKRSLLLFKAQLFFSELKLFAANLWAASVAQLRFNAQLLAARALWLGMAQSRTHKYSSRCPVVYTKFMGFYGGVVAV